MVGNISTDVNTIITGLTTGTLYHFRVKAINDLGTVYSTDMTFSTLTPISDLEGNNYNIVTIGTQIWMAENLNRRSIIMENL